jgi:hypothetical protein
MFSYKKEKIALKRAITENLLQNGRGGEIRTHDLLYPKQARYQATLRPDIEEIMLPRAQRESNVEFS